MSEPWPACLPRPQWRSFKQLHVPGDWVEVYEVQPGVFALYEPRHWEEVISYLVLGRNRALMWDTGMGFVPIRPLIESLTQLPVTVVNSHTHFDHIGGNWEFGDVRTHSNPYARLRSEGGLEDVWRNETTLEKLAEPLPAVLPKRTRPFDITKFVHDDERLDLGGRVLRVIASPGHSPDHICLLDENNGLLFTGDIFYEAPIYVAGEGTNFADFVASTHRLAALVPQVKALLPSHNTPFSAPGNLLKLRDAAEAINSGAAKPARVSIDRAEFDFEEFGIWTRPDRDSH
jgi:glyoxylase-like metal-dependent hydrolase (beta-lactamase superfamily II)